MGDMLEIEIARDLLHIRRDKGYAKHTVRDSDRIRLSTHL